jgi:hypothetical protein
MPLLKLGNALNEEDFKGQRKYGGSNKYSNDRGS